MHIPNHFRIVLTKEQDKLPCILVTTGDHLQDDYVCNMEMLDRRFIHKWRESGNNKKRFTKMLSLYNVIPVKNVSRQNQDNCVGFQETKRIILKILGL